MYTFNIGVFCSYNKVTDSNQASNQFFLFTLWDKAGAQGNENESLARR